LARVSVCDFLPRVQRDYELVANGTTELQESRRRDRYLAATACFVTGVALACPTRPTRHALRGDSGCEAIFNSLASGSASKGTAIIQYPSWNGVCEADQATLVGWY
jgi:hypothetical protein